MCIRILALVLGVWTSMASFGALADSSATYVGERECYACHKAYKRSYESGAHGKAFVNHPLELQARGCEACHGPGSAHIDVAGEEGYRGPLKINAFKDAGPQTNRYCLNCHQGDGRNHWQGSAHQMAAVNCTSCHRLHSEGPTVTAEVCGSCHMEQKAKLQRARHMPLREGKMSCMSCHNPHGGSGPAQLVENSINQTCYRCHAEKRGPFLWEHPPARENCANCHDPHGSTQLAMLSMRPPYLCQNCHSQTFHPSTAYDGAVAAALDKHQIRKGCVNCHTQVHGSNHPSGARFQR